MRRLILRSHQSPGDVLMLTAAVRELHTAYSGQFMTDVRTSANALWERNPRITQLSETESGVEVIDMHYPLIHQSNQRPYHFIHGYVQFLEQRLGLSIPITRFAGEVFLSDEERQWPIPDFDLPEEFAIIVAGGKNDFTAKWWDPARYQEVVDHYRGIIPFVQCGEAGHWHPPLRNVTNLVGKTTLRQFTRLMHHAALVVCPVTFAMHLASAVETRPGRPKLRPCVVIAGGREPAHWEQYPGHQFLSNNGALSCCREGGCWKSRCQLIGDGDDKDRHNICEQPVQVSSQLRIAKCLQMITADHVISRIDTYLEGGALKSSHGSHRTEASRNGHADVAPATAASTLTERTSTEEVPMNPAIENWERMPGLAREVSCGPDGVIWCLGTGALPDGASIHRWNGSDWDAVQRGAVRIAAGPNREAWIISQNNHIASRIGNGWTLRPGLAREISIGANGDVWCISPADIAPGGGSIHAWTTGNWVHIDGAAVRIAVGPDGQPWIANSAGQIFRRSGEGWELLPGLASEIAIGPDGVPWCLSFGFVGQGHSIHVWNGKDWDHVPGCALKIAVGPESVVIVDPELGILRKKLAAG